MKVKVRGGKLYDERRQQIARIVSIELDVEEEWFAEAISAVAERLGGKGGAVDVGSKETISEGLTVGVGSPREGADRASDEDVGCVWAVYAELMNPRRLTATTDDRRIIRDALKVATVDECVGAVRGCALSKFHMGENDKKNKYNRLSQILKGRRGRETTRERIDFFLDLADKAAQGESRFPSADPGVLTAKRLDVQRGWRFKGDSEAVTKAKDAEAWLWEHGIEVVRKTDGYPTFRAIRGTDQ